jgi:hypothetical protein
VLFANPSPTDNTDSNSICIFAFSCAFITFHCSPSNPKVFLSHFRLESIVSTLYLAHLAQRTLSLTFR